MQFDFQPAAFERLEALRERTESTTKAEVVRRALRVYEWMVEAAAAGRSITLSGGNEEDEGPIEVRRVI